LLLMVRATAEKLAALTADAARAAKVAARAARRYPAAVLGPDLVTPPADASADWSDTWQRTITTPSSGASAAATWLGHCSVLLRFAGMTILTDPVWSSRIGVRIGGRTIGIPRLHAPPIPLASLPPIDLILISHAHIDHLDRPTLLHLARPHTRVITARHTASLIPKGFARVDELHWDQTLDVGPLHLRAIRPNHWGARTAWDRHRGFNSYWLTDSAMPAPTAPAPRSILFAGDTAMTDAFDHLHADTPDLAIMGIGAYDPFERAHATPEQVWQMASAMRARRLMPVHFGTFRLSDEPPGDPMRRLLAAASASPQAPTILTPALAQIHMLAGS
jgi:L-ascorbate metabolism protein UlaG (beta-lactamase superfamily)